MMSINPSDSAILTINGSNYCCNINWISKSEAVNLLQRAYLTKKVEHYKSNFFFIVYKKMDEEIITFDDIETEKHKSHRYKSFIFAEDLDIDDILVFNKISSGEKNHKFFIGYLYDDFKIN